jgi:hypothetical protein
VNRHTRQYDDSDGEFSLAEESDRHCDQCGALMTVARWDSSDGAYTDEKYTCPVCAWTLWVDGSDA